eukprot:scaffold368_cov258-Pinguiococcus_pyrenoidosus.AAC.31
MRELNLPAIIRIWDTYLSEKDGFEAFHTYLCATLLCHFSDDLRTMKFQDLVLFLQVHAASSVWNTAHAASASDHEPCAS